MDPAKILDRPEGRFGEMFPANAHLCNFASMHEMVHAGQVLLIRRMLGMPRVIG